MGQLHDVEPGLARLRVHLATGTWLRRHADLLDRSELDLGDRLIIARPARNGEGRRSS